MKNLILLFILALAISGCKKDPCENQLCLNNGICIDGTCLCTQGYSGINCQDFNPCEGVTCLNGGTCVNGNCNCPTGYGGANCGTQLTPTAMRITSIRIDGFPPTKSSGSGWDVSSGPDIYASLSVGSSCDNTDYTTNYLSNCIYGSSYSLGANVRLNNIYSTYSICLWDDDGIDADDSMGGYYFTPNDRISGLPSTIRLYNASTSYIDLTLSVSWEY